jgi:mannitol/fructose-specific phosphotransferase system IIA component (Ntr-type)
VVKLLDMISPRSLVVPLAAATRDEAMDELVDALVAAGQIDPGMRDELVQKLLAREQRHSTGFGRGVAVPHAKHQGLPRLVAAVGLSPRGIDFASLDSQPVYSIILLLSPESKPEEHLQAMEVIFKNLTKESFRRALRQAREPGDVLKLLQETDGQHLAG